MNSRLCGLCRQTQKARLGPQPATGEEVAIPSGKTIRFKPGKELQAHGFGDEDGHEENEGPTTGRQPDSEF